MGLRKMSDNDISIPLKSKIWYCTIREANQFFIRYVVNSLNDKFAII